MNFPVFVGSNSDFGYLFPLHMLKFVQMSSLSVEVICLLED